MFEFILNHPWYSLLIVIVIFHAVVFLYDITQKKSSIKHNFPVVGHLRYLLERIGPELRQYWVANDKEETPFNRAERRWIYATSKKQDNNFGFGTTEELYESGYPILKHAAFPLPEDQVPVIHNDPTAIPCLKVIGETHKRKKAWRPSSIINISAMSFGALGRNATMSLNRGAKGAGCYQNTGEGGISPYHLQGGDIVWQLGTGYFGARDENGNFSLSMLTEKVNQYPQVKMIEIKLSQGAKPGKGGILPASKVTKEVAQIRGVPEGVECDSPNHHSAFSDVPSMIKFIESIAEATGLPVGIKSAVGEEKFWHDLAAAMKRTKAGPDYIVIDGGEGGTGAAPLAFSDHIALPFKTGFTRVYKIFQKEKLTDQVAWVGAGKLGFPDRAAVAFAMGCDMIYVAREAMISIGCIQAMKCHTGHCPTGITTTNRWLERGLDVDDKSMRSTTYIQGFRKELLTIAHAMGYEHPAQIKLTDIEIGTGLNHFQTLADDLGYNRPQIKYKGFAAYQ